MARIAVFVLLSVLVHYLASPSMANENNLLLTGDTLRKDEQLSYGSATFVMQNDCNLVLYTYSKHSGFVSNTFNQGSDCRLTLNDRGQLVIRTSNGTVVWTSGPRSKAGKYAAVIRPDGQVAVYGPSVWSTPDFGFDPTASAGPALGARMNTIPAVRNVLFSDQTLYNNAKLATRDYTLAMQADCNLVLTKAVLGDIWDSQTQGKGANCFVRLSHQGLLAVEDDRSRTLWTSSAAASKQGDYVLVLQINGQAVVYGPVIWSTSSSS